LSNRKIDSHRRRRRPSREYQFSSSRDGRTSTCNSRPLCHLNLPAHQQKLNDRTSCSILCRSWRAALTEKLLRMNMVCTRRISDLCHPWFHLITAVGNRYRTVITCSIQCRRTVHPWGMLPLAICQGRERTMGSLLSSDSSTRPPVSCMQHKAVAMTRN